jgi:hypothetical protein
MRPKVLSDFFEDALTRSGDSNTHYSDVLRLPPATLAATKQVFQIDGALQLLQTLSWQ